MNEIGINKFVKCLVDAATLSAEGELEGKLPLYEAEKIKNLLTKEEFIIAAKKAVVELLNKNFPMKAISWILEFQELVDLKNDSEIKKLAEIKYQQAKLEQLEFAQELKNFFDLK